MISTNTSCSEGDSPISLKEEMKYETIEFQELSKLIKQVEVENLLNSSTY